MGFAVQIVADSVAFDVRLTTFLVTFPRFILAEVNTHRMLSRNSASSRAIPVERRIESMRSPGGLFIPEAFASNKRGMQAGPVLESDVAELARRTWISGAAAAIVTAEDLGRIKAHKQWANRPLEPYAWHTALLTATEWDNFWNLRTDKAAQPEFQKLARMMREAFAESTPAVLTAGEWHLPFINHAEALGVVAGATWEGADPMTRLLKISVGRCAATSYERATDERTSDEWVALHDRLLPVGHLSPFEHQAKVIAPYRDGAFPPPFAPVYTRVENYTPASWHVSHYACANFRAPWLQYRKTLPGEAVWRAPT